MNSLPPWEIKIDIFVDEEFKYTRKAKSESLIRDLKSNILQQTGLYSINYLLFYSNRDYTKFDNWKLKQIFLAHKEVQINLKTIDTYKKEQNQRVIMTLIEGTLEIFFFKIFNQKFDKIIPEKSKYIPFEVFPYNCRYCHIKKENKLIISGGVDFDKYLCSYDYDLNFIEELPEMIFERQMHSMINIDERIFFVGGNHSKKVECFNMHFEDYVKYPEMNYDRRECGLALVNDGSETYLYAFMGYSNLIGDVCKNIERINLNLDSDESEWKLLPMQNPHFFENCFTTNLGILNYKKGFLLIGGIAHTTSTKNVYYYDLETFEINRSIYKLPFEGSFTEKSMFSYNNEDFWLFSYGNNQLIKFDMKLNSLNEIFQL